MTRKFLTALAILIFMQFTSAVAQVCWRYEHDAACTSYPITDFTLTTPFPGAAGLPERHVDFATNLGWLFETNERVALGPAFFFSAYLNGGWHSQWGLHGRGRFYLTEKWQLQISPGVIVRDSPYPDGFAGYSVAVDVMHKDWVGFTARLDVVKSYPEGHDTVFLFGLKAGSYIGMGMSGAGAVVGGIAYIVSQID
ncbi:hypothetical protein HUU05_28235 [candidate division KSB1 bacterium]|nr:hypothetical protein [candidate division KSB1 bacterium]